LRGFMSTFKKIKKKKNSSEAWVQKYINACYERNYKPSWHKETTSES
jgi:hypothetical protein